MIRSSLALVVLALLVGLAPACTTTTTATCDAPSTACSATVCADLDNDPAHCGTCDNACSTGQVCVSGGCQCPGATLADGGVSATLKACAGICVDLSSDSLNCGACGTKCAPGELCTSSQCAPCATGTCDVSAVALLATCFNTGELVAINPHLAKVGSSVVAGSGPQSLGLYGSQALVADTLDNALYTFDLTYTPPRKVLAGDQLGKAVNQVLVSGQKAYSINSGDNDVQVLDLTKPQPSSIDTSRTLNEIPLATDTYPSFGAFAGGKLYVTLMGSCTTTAGATAGNKLVQLDDSTVPGTVARTLSFAASDYEKDATAASNSPRPGGLAALGTKLYVAIGNLLDGCVGAAGPGYLAVVDTAADPLVVSSNIKLPDGCRNPGFVVASGTKVYVSCLGAYGYGTTPEEGLVVVDTVANSTKLTTFPPCPTGAPSDGPNACRTATPGRMTLLGNQLVIADANGGRLFSTDLDGNITPGLEQGSSICLYHCPSGNTNCSQFTSDVLAMP